MENGAPNSALAPLSIIGVSPFNDFMFKKIFGTIGNEELLKAFLNAVMKDKNLPLISEVTIIEKLELEKNHYEEKLGIIDMGTPTVRSTILNCWAISKF